MLSNGMDMKNSVSEEVRACNHQFNYFFYCTLTSNESLSIVNSQMFISMFAIKNLNVIGFSLVSVSVNKAFYNLDAELTPPLYQPVAKP